MENINIILENGLSTLVNGLLYVYNSKYYFVYTTKEIDDQGYVKLYVSQICKEIQNTPTGPVDTGYMIGMEISDHEEWEKVQQSITKIVDDKKNQTMSPEIQYLPINMIQNLKIIGKNKFKLMRHIIEENFAILISLPSTSNQEILNNISSNKELNEKNDSQKSGEIIIDYRSRFFEEQEKNQKLEEQIKNLNKKLEDIKTILE